MAAVAGVEGWMSPDQARRLFDAAAATRPGDRIVEIGSFRGRSTIVLASAAPDGVGIVAIDPHAGNDRGPQEFDGYAAEAATDHEVFNANLAAAGVAHRVRHVRAFSDAAHAQVEGEVDVLYIDGAHRYRPARADIRDWGARVAPGGTMLIHDSFSSVGVTGAIMRELLAGRRFRYVGRARSLTEYRADLDGSPRSRAVNALRQLAQLPWFATNVLLKVLLLLRLGPVLRRITGREPEWPY
ncbi:MAG: class I SAM-dependent methyltransferase [Acidimicrobiaceae bacterium]|nr:class I SAM-dependent methyltransferase [Ilumatobacter sp.]MCB9380003.1 class I SAM-dependent methyltransferase [Acidimicrobiaceae bacterium]